MASLVEPAAVGVQELEGHDLDVPVDAGDADAVVAHGADGAGDVRAVAVVVHRVAVVVDEVVAVDVVDVAVAVVVDAVAGDLARVGPDVGGQVGVGVVDAGVDHGHDGRAGCRWSGPRPRRRRCRRRRCRRSGPVLFSPHSDANCGSLGVRGEPQRVVGLGMGNEGVTAETRGTHQPRSPRPVRPPTGCRARDERYRPPPSASPGLAGRGLRANSQSCRGVIGRWIGAQLPSGQRLDE